MREKLNFKHIDLVLRSPSVVFPDSKDIITLENQIEFIQDFEEMVKEHASAENIGAPEKEKKGEFDLGINPQLNFYQIPGEEVDKENEMKEQMKKINLEAAREGAISNVYPQIFHFRKKSEKN